MKKERYHHGNLRQALLEASEAILNEGDITALTLRSAAARAGVSHAAPSHHFGSLQGLLTALASVGMDRFVVTLEAGLQSGQPNAAYVRFARDNRGLFKLMFDKTRVDYNDPALGQAGLRAFEILGEIAALSLPHNASAQQRTNARLQVWARAHGYAMLMLSGHLEKFDIGEDQLGLLDLVMRDDSTP